MSEVVCTYIDSNTSCICRYGGIRVALLHLDIFNDGRWYNMTKKSQLKLDPVLINNNFIIGNMLLDNISIQTYTLKTFSAVFFAHPIAQGFISLKTQALLVRIPPEAKHYIF